MRSWGGIIAVVGMVVASMLLVSCGGSSRETKLDDAWRTVLSRDYPGWTPVGPHTTFRKDSYDDYVFLLTPPGSSVRIPVWYRSEGASRRSPRDDVFRTDAPFPTHASELLDFLEAERSSPRLQLSHIYRTEDGTVTIDWTVNDDAGGLAAPTEILIWDGKNGCWKSLCPPIE